MATLRTARTAEQYGVEGEELNVANAVDLPVRDGEEPWSESELSEVRLELTSEIARLRQEISDSESELAERLSESAAGAGDDLTDTSAKAYQREHDLALAHNTRELLAQTERAIERMDAGTFGVCETCGGAIGKARLQAFPRATQCVTCKQREERR